MFIVKKYHILLCGRKTNIQLKRVAIKWKKIFKITGICDDSVYTIYIVIINDCTH